MIVRKEFNKIVRGRNVSVDKSIFDEVLNEINAEIKSDNVISIKEEVITYYGYEYPCGQQIINGREYKITVYYKE